jgi:hypothetical protein
MSLCFRFLVAGAATAMLSACGANIESSSGTSGRSTSGTAPFLTPMPSGTENPDQVFVSADMAFRGGDWVRAQREFGTLFIIAPSYGGNIPTDALAQTCANLRIDCGIAFGRLEFLRDAYYGTFGQANTWVPEQVRDYEAIVTCYDRYLIGDFDAAIAAGGPVTASPLDGFRRYAARCADAAVAQRDAILRQQAIDQAFATWFEFYPCFELNHGTVMQAYDLGDWDAVVRALPEYNRCAGPVDGVVTSGVLDGDPRVADELDLAWGALGEVEAITGTHGATLQQMADGLVRLEADPNYQTLKVQHDQIVFDEQRQLNQIASIEAVAASLDPAARGPLDAQIQQEYALLGQIRAALGQVMAQVNAIRAYYGLPARERI